MMVSAVADRLAVLGEASAWLSKWLAGKFFPAVADRLQDQSE